MYILRTSDVFLSIKVNVECFVFRIGLTKTRIVRHGSNQPTATVQAKTTGTPGQVSEWSAYVALRSILQRAGTRRDADLFAHVKSCWKIPQSYLMPDSDGGVISKPKSEGSCPVVIMCQPYTDLKNHVQFNSGPLRICGRRPSYSQRYCYPIERSTALCSGAFFHRGSPKKED